MYEAKTIHVNRTTRQRDECTITSPTKTLDGQTDQATSPKKGSTARANWSYCMEKTKATSSNFPSRAIICMTCAASRQASRSTKCEDPFKVLSVMSAPTTRSARKG